MAYTEFSNINDLEWLNEDNLTADHYSVAVGNVRGNLLWTNSVVATGERPENPDDGSGSGSGSDTSIISAVENMTASMINATTIRLEWDKPEIPEDIDNPYNIKNFRISTDNSTWMEFLAKDLNISDIRETINVNGQYRIYCTIGYRNVLPNMTYYIQIATNGSTTWSNSDSLWWLDSFKWLSHRWCESNIERNESPLFLAHIYRIRGKSEIARIVELKTSSFLSYDAQNLIIDSLDGFEYQTDSFEDIIVDALEDIEISEYILSDENTTTSASMAVLDVLSIDDLFIYPDPSSDITSVVWSVEQAKGGFNKYPTAISGFSAISVSPKTCMLETPFQDRFSRDYDEKGYNFVLEPSRQNVSGVLTHPFSTSGTYIFKVVITPLVGNDIILTYNVTVSS